MHDDHDALLAALGRAAREAPDAPDAWVEHAAGTLDPQGRMALRGAAASDPRDRAALDLLEPLGPAFDDALAERLLAEVAPAAAESGAESTTSTASRDGPPVAAWIGGLVLLAAAVVLGIGLTRPDTLPDYHFELQAGERAIRGAADGPRPIELFADSRIALTVRPADAVEGPVAVGAFVRQGKTVSRFEPKTICAASGACRVEGIVGELLGDVQGEATLVFVVTRPDAMPAASAVGDFEPRFERAVTVRRD